MNPLAWRCNDLAMMKSSFGRDPGAGGVRRYKIFPFRQPLASGSSLYRSEMGWDAISNMWIEGFQGSIRLD